MHLKFYNEKNEVIFLQTDEQQKIWFNNKRTMILNNTNCIFVFKKFWVHVSITT